MIAGWQKASDAELYEALVQAHLSDGLPVVRPTHAALEAFLAAGGTRGSERVGSVLDREASAESVALCAILAGCAPEHIPILHACIRALADPALNARGVLTTTGSAALAVIINGPLRRRLGFNAGANCLGPGVRSNATVGRALSLVTRFIGRAIPGVTDMSTMGQPGKYTFCFAENEEEELVRRRRARLEPLRASLRVAIDAEDILVVVAGGVGVKQTFVPNWNGSSRAVTIAVEDR